MFFIWYERDTLPVFTGLGRCPIVNWDFVEQWVFLCPSCRPPMTFTGIRTCDLSSISGVFYSNKWGAAPAALTFLSVALSLQKVGHPWLRWSDGIFSHSITGEIGLTSSLWIALSLRKTSIVKCPSYKCSQMTHEWSISSDSAGSICGVVTMSSLDEQQTQ